MPSPLQESIVRNTVLLGSIKRNAEQASSVPETQVREYHAVLTKIKLETGLDMSAFRVPDSDLAPVMTSMNTFKEEKKFTKEKFVARQIFLDKINGVLKELQTNLSKAKS